MLKSNLLKSLVIIPMIIALTACESMPGNRKQQGAVIGGAAGAATGAVIAKNNRGLGALIGGLLGAGGGYIIGAKTDKTETNDQQGAATAARKAQENPATAADAQKAMTADLNYDGFVTMDEVVALKHAGYSDEEMIKRLRATDQMFELNEEQQKYLTDHGVSRNVVNQMLQMNKATAQPATTTTTNSIGNEVIGQPK